MSSETATAETSGTTDQQPDAPLQSIQIFPKREHYGADKKPLCAYGGCVCTQRPMRGYSFCVKHILQDSTAPFKQCDFISRQSGKRCGNPVPKTQEDNKYCNAHRQMLGLAPRGSAGYSRRKKKANAEAKEDKKEGTTKKKESSKKRLQSTAAVDDTETEDETVTTTSKKKKKKATTTSTAATNAGSLLLPIPEDGTVVKTEDEDSHAVYYDNSETDSDVPTDVEEDEDQPDISLSKAFRNEEVVTEEEYLKLRKERIEKLLSIYQAKYYHLKYELKAQYDEFIKQRNVAINDLLKGEQKKSSSDEHPENPSEANSAEAGGVEVKLHVTNPESANHTQYKQLLASFVHYPHRASGEPLQCTKVLKHDPEGVLLCSYANCTSTRLFLSEFCFKHILYDANQVLYTADKTGEPVMIFSQVPIAEEAAPITPPKKSKKIVLVEDKRKKKSGSSKQVTEAVNRGPAEAAPVQRPSQAASPPKINPPENGPEDEEEEELLIKEEAEEMDDDDFGDDEDEGMPNAD